MTIPEIIYESSSFPNAWVKAVKHVMRSKSEITFGGKMKDKEPPQYERKKAYDSDQIIVLEGQALEEALAGVLHPKFPTKNQHKEAYLREWDRGYDWRKQGFSYCYENRGEAYLGVTLKRAIPEYQIIDQWKLAREDIANQIATDIQSNRNVIVIGNPSIDRFEIPDSPPCLREIWIRWEGKDRISVKSLWRSRDLFAAWPVNICGLLNAVQREVVEPNKCKMVQYVDKSHSLHIYHYDWDDASKVELLPVNLALMR